MSDGQIRQVSEQLVEVIAEVDTARTSSEDRQQRLEDAMAILAMVSLDPDTVRAHAAAVETAQQDVRDAHVANDQRLANVHEVIGRLREAVTDDPFSPLAPAAAMLVTKAEKLVQLESDLREARNELVAVQVRESHETADNPIGNSDAAVQLTVAADRVEDLQRLVDSSTSDVKDAVSQLSDADGGVTFGNSLDDGGSAFHDPRDDPQSVDDDGSRAFGDEDPEPGQPAVERPEQDFEEMGYPYA